MVFTSTGTSRSIEVAIQGDASSLRSAVDASREGLLNLRNATRAAGGALAALSAGGFAAAASGAAAFESQMVEVEKVTNPETAREMSEAIQEMARTIPLAQKELAHITASAGRFGIRGSENIESFTRSVAKMSVATNLSSQEAGESLARLATLTQTPITQIENLGSTVNALSNNFSTSSQEIVDSMLRAGAALSQVGLSQREIAGLSTALNEVSESSERAGTRLRRVGQVLMDPKQTQDLAAALGMSAEGFRSMREEAPLRLIRRLVRAFADGGAEAEALRSTLDVTSQQALSGLSQNLDGMTDSLGLASESFEENTSLQEEFDAATDTFNARLQTTRNRLRTLAQTTGESLLPGLKDALGATNNLLDGFNRLNRETDGLAGQLTLLGGVAGGVGLAFGGAAGLIAGAGVAAFIAWNKNMAGIKDVTDRTVEDVNNSLSRLSENLSAELGGAAEDNIGIWQDFGITASKWLDTLNTRMRNLLDAAVTFGNTMVDLVQELDQARKGNTEGVIREFESAKSRVRGFFDRFGERRSGLSTRNEQRREARRQGDPSLLPQNRGESDEDTASSSSSPESEGGITGGTTLADLESVYREAMEKNREAIRENAGYNKAMSSSLQNSALVQSQSRCDIKEHLLGDFERAGRPRPREQVQSSVGSGSDANFDVKQEGSGRPGPGESSEKKVAINVDGERLAETTFKQWSDKLADEFIVE